jgi:hypothetical protein
MPVNFEEGSRRSNNGLGKQLAAMRLSWLFPSNVANDKNCRALGSTICTTTDKFAILLSFPF